MQFGAEDKNLTEKRHKTKEWVVITGFIFLARLIIYVTLDLARPMSGFIRPDVGQERIEQL